MIHPRSPELFWLAATRVMTGLLWVPYVANRVKELGLPGWQWFLAADPPPSAPWAARAMRAHFNALENLAIFAPLAIGVHVAGAGNAATAMASQLYFATRAVHYAVCLAGMPIAARTIAFLLGVGAQLTLGATLLGAVVR
jgi:uncharacterized MAPEG superfamily protein